MSADVSVPTCYRRRHRQPVEMQLVGERTGGLLAITYFECPRCGNVRRFEHQLFQQLELPVVD